MPGVSAPPPAVAPWWDLDYDDDDDMGPPIDYVACYAHYLAMSEEEAKRIENIVLNDDESEMSKEDESERSNDDVDNGGGHTGAGGHQAAEHEHQTLMLELHSKELCQVSQAELSSEVGESVEPAHQAELQLEREAALADYSMMERWCLTTECAMSNNHGDEGEMSDDDMGPPIDHAACYEYYLTCSDEEAKAIELIVLGDNDGGGGDDDDGGAHTGAGEHQPTEHEHHTMMLERCQVTAELSSEVRESVEPELQLEREAALADDPMVERWCVDHTVLQARPQFRPPLNYCKMGASLEEELSGTCCDRAGGRAVERLVSSRGAVLQEKEQHARPPEERALHLQLESLKRYLEQHARPPEGGMLHLL